MVNVKDIFLIKAHQIYTVEKEREKAQFKSVIRESNSLILMSKMTC